MKMYRSTFGTRAPSITASNDQWTCCSMEASNRWRWKSSNFVSSPTDFQLTFYLWNSFIYRTFEFRYVLKRGDGFALPMKQVWTGNAWTFTSEGLFQHTHYRFAVAAVNSVGIGKYSNSSGFHTKSGHDNGLIPHYPSSHSRIQNTMIDCCVAEVCPGGLGDGCFSNGVCDHFARVRIFSTLFFFFFFCVNVLNFRFYSYWFDFDWLFIWFI